MIIGHESVPFKSGDLFVIGSNVPHVFRKSSEYSTVSVSSLYINSQKINLLQESFDELSFTKDLMMLKGCLKYPENSQIKKQLVALKESQGFESFQILLEFINTLNNMKSRQEISILEWKKNPDDRINAVMDFVYQNFQNDIRLEEASEIAHMTVPAFCRYFKRYTRKTFLDFVTQVRIRNACELISKTTLQYSEIAEVSGYRNLSNFNRQFRKITGKTPSAYRNDSKS